MVNLLTTVKSNLLHVLIWILEYHSPPASTYLRILPVPPTVAPATLVVVAPSTISQVALSCTHALISTESVSKSAAGCADALAFSQGSDGHVPPVP